MVWIVFAGSGSSPTPTTPSSPTGSLFRSSLPRSLFTLFVCCWPFLLHWFCHHHHPHPSPPPPVSVYFTHGSILPVVHMPLPLPFVHCLYFVFVPLYRLMPYFILYGSYSQHFSPTLLFSYRLPCLPLPAFLFHFFLPPYMPHIHVPLYMVVTFWRPAFYLLRLYMLFWQAARIYFYTTTVLVKQHVAALWPLFLAFYIHLKTGQKDKTLFLFYTVSVPLFRCARAAWHFICLFSFPFHRIRFCAGIGTFCICVGVVGRVAGWFCAAALLLPYLPPTLLPPTKPLLRTFAFHSELHLRYC